MNVAHAELVHCNSNECEFKGFHAVPFYERKFQRIAYKGCNTFLKLMEMLL